MLTGCTVSQILRCSAEMDQVHKQAEFKLDSACNWQPVELLECRRHVVTKTKVEHQFINRIEIEI